MLRVVFKVRFVVFVGVVEVFIGVVVGVFMEVVGILFMVNFVSFFNCVLVEAGVFGWVEGVVWGIFLGFCLKENLTGVVDVGVVDDLKENFFWVGVEDWGCFFKEKGGVINKKKFIKFDKYFNI